MYVIILNLSPTCVLFWHDEFLAEWNFKNIPRFLLIPIFKK